MSLKSWFYTLFRKSDPLDENVVEVSDVEFQNLYAELAIRELAFASAINIMANAISKCEFKTYINDNRIKSDEWYVWNVESNHNQNSSEFLKELITKLYSQNEVLVIAESTGLNKTGLFVADSFERKEYLRFENTYRDVTVKDFKYERTFIESEVLNFKLNHGNVRKLINAMYETYGKLITYAQQMYKKSRGRKGVLKIDAQVANDPKFKERLDDLLSNKFAKYFNADNAVLPLFNGYDYNEQESKTYTNEGTRDIRAMVNDIYDDTARAFQIPPTLLRGDVAGIEQAVDYLLTFTVDPLCRLLEKEINRKRFGKAILQGTYVEIETRTFNHIDLLKSTAPIDKLVSSGVFSVNGVAELIGEKSIDEEWADKHFITKNFTEIEDLINQMGGGGSG